MYLVPFSTLHITAFNLGSLIFELIDRVIPGAASSRFSSWSTEHIRWAISSHFVSFPVFLYVSALTRREIQRAVFDRETSPYRYGDEFWEDGAGRRCFSREVRQCS